MIYELLEVGYENARTTAELAEQLGISHRDVTIAVERERRLEKRPICASSAGKNGGFYIARNKREMKAFCESMRHRAGEIFQTRSELLKTIDDLPEEELELEL